jgi:hypothetical protein
MLLGPAKIPEDAQHARHQLLLADGCGVKTGPFKSMVLFEPQDLEYNKCLAAPGAKARDEDGDTDSGTSTSSL